ncbi:hypothetical protein KY290_015651 [Solanum tuberosum]|uniref:Uncharacterized protein n=1 Tax=Solanum tuberosum TaxID=4113 RepID=A0ABQ7VT41_SOLTU|nr:hypothetical protein KY289_015216 [Solanum tuberosum]KAH0700760.1 hypothetical protein KY284_014975 [Solanum tuberosum]KAH0700762.1 hypothetical protein KY284_014977 [Solanum tuberosum]KAH0718978.1 hypothetical protein KY285_015009 [Solanum tuberosum]KAH0718979.1 hypothetical protein KY285_015010 [Solanum tuberosum]
MEGLFFNLRALHHLLQPALPASDRVFHGRLSYSHGCNLILIQTFSKDISHLFNKQKTIRCHHLLLDLSFNKENTISGQACGVLQGFEFYELH